LVLRGRRLCGEFLLITRGLEISSTPRSPRKPRLGKVNLDYVEGQRTLLDFALKMANH
jgi:hypothetical protein